MTILGTSHKAPGTVLIIAGSDSGGGAGIQGDIKTVTCLGGYAATAITALTAQNTRGVFGIHDVPDDFIAQQIELVLSDIGADSIKIGMLHKTSVIETITDALYSSPHRGEAGRGALSARNYPIPNIREFARELRKTMTDAEQLVWKFLRGKQLGAKFRKQHPVGPYIADFACLEQKLIIELDGGQHAEQSNIQNDKTRSEFLEAQGFTVLRFWNHECFENTEAVLQTIYNTLHSVQASPHPNPPPAGEGIPLILDTVMFAKGGAALLQPEAIDALKTLLIPRATIITPNIPEAEHLTGIEIRNREDMKKAAQALLALGPQAVLLKGGHADGDTVSDLLLSGNLETWLESPRRDTRHTHGTGCTFASAIATGIAQHMPLEKAVKRAHAYVAAAIAHAPGLGHGHGPLGHLIPAFIAN